MPDQRRHRGAHPADARLFAEARLDELRAAVADYSWLLTRAYGEVAALKVVGDRYGLVARQRMAVMRCACSDQALARRAARRVEPAQCRGASLAIDGYNLLITVESGLAAGVILVGRDGCFRDLASVHGTYRRVDETASAVALIAEHLAELGVAHVDWYLDAPVSNSGRLKALMADVLEQRLGRTFADTWNIELVPDPDRRLRDCAHIVVTTDSVVLDGCGSWTHLAGQIVRACVPGAWIVDLTVR